VEHVWEYATVEAEELYRVFKQHPFTPVRVYVSDGSSYDITHPDQVIVSRRASHIGMRRDGQGPQGPFLNVAIVANIHITRVEPLKRRRTRSSQGSS
jgi:hypothetical protein